MLQKLDYTEQQFLERYDLVLHLVTTAHGVEHIYNVQKANNPARGENAQQARDLDDKVFSCWSAHPLIKRLDNDTDFATKITSCGDAVLDMIRTSPDRSQQADDSA